MIWAAIPLSSSLEDAMKFDPEVGRIEGEYEHIRLKEVKQFAYSFTLIERIPGMRIQFCFCISNWISSISRFWLKTAIYFRHTLEPNLERKINYQGLSGSEQKRSLNPSYILQQQNFIKLASS
jgi:hypothetical protein